MKHSKRPFIILIIIIVLLVAGNLVYRYLDRTRFNDGWTYGNTAGNYYNKGLFCEYDGTVYFSNPFDEYRLYSMTPTGTEAKMVSDDHAGSINVDSHYVYYVRDNGSKDTSFSFLRFNTNSLCRISTNGKSKLLLETAPSLYATLVGNYIYYIHYDAETASSLYKVRIDGEERDKVSSSPLLLSASDNGNLCYSGVEEDHYIRLWNTETDTSSILYTGICYNPVDSGEYVYFMDCENNYQLARYNKSTGEVTTLTDYRVDCYNITNDYLYYQKNDESEPALCRIPLDGSGGEEIVMQGIFSNINVTSVYVYFRSFQNQDAFFQTPADGPIQVTNFSFEAAK